MQNRQVLNVLAYEPPTWGDTELRMLDAAAELITTRGIDGLSVTVLAKAAGVSRPTVYRSWPGSDEIVRATLLRATISLFERLGNLPGTREQITDAIVRFSTLFREDPLFSSLLQRQPELFTRYSLERVGSSQRFMLRWIATAVEAGQAHGSVRKGVSGDLAVMLLLVAQSATLSHRAVSSLIGDNELDQQLRTAIDSYLRAEA
jgi:AcrR family transcriptional regulator